MNIDYATPLKKAFAFCLEPKRWLPFFILDLAFVATAFTLVMSNSMTFLFMMMSASDIGVSGDAAALLLELVGLFAVWALASVWVTGAVIHQSHKEKEFRKSWKASWKRYLSLLGATAVTAVIAGLGGMIPAVGWILAILVSLVFFFALQGVMIKGHGVMKSLEDSWHIFRHQPFKVFLMWLLIAALSAIIILIFAMPILGLTTRIVLDVAGTGGNITSSDLINLITMIQTQFTLFVVSGMILVLGMAITRVLAVKAQTEFYLQLRKPK
jgi:hypothetical protein